MHARSSTNPPDHKVLPDLPSKPKDESGTNTDAADTQKANLVALAKLRQKNRKGNEFIIDMPLNLAFESGTVYLLSGFSPDADAANWVLIDVAHAFKGKGGSTTKCTFQKALTY